MLSGADRPPPHTKTLRNLNYHCRLDKAKRANLLRYARKPIIAVALEFLAGCLLRPAPYTEKWENHRQHTEQIVALRLETNNCSGA